MRISLSLARDVHGPRSGARLSRRGQRTNKPDGVKNAVFTPLQRAQHPGASIFSASHDFRMAKRRKRRAPGLDGSLLKPLLDGFRAFLFLVPLFLACEIHAAPVHGWLSWRGPQQNGTALEKNLPDKV